MHFQDSQTYQNLLVAFEGESKAHTRYDIFSKKAREDGFEQIGDIFQETSKNEQEHAEIWYKWILESYEIPSTITNLEESVANENLEFSQIYKEFARTARQEGFPEIARLFNRVATIEKNHAERFETLAENIETSQVFEKDTRTNWICQVCGHETCSTSSPEICPVCGHPQAFTEVKATNY